MINDLLDDLQIMRIKWLGFNVDFYVTIQARLLACFLIRSDPHIPIVLFLLCLGSLSASALG